MDKDRKISTEVINNISDKIAKRYPAFPEEAHSGAYDGAVECFFRGDVIDEAAILTLAHQYGSNWGDKTDDYYLRKDTFFDGYEAMLWHIQNEKANSEEMLVTENS